MDNEQYPDEDAGDMLSMFPFNVHHCLTPYMYWVLHMNGLVFPLELFTFVKFFRRILRKSLFTNTQQQQ